MSSCKTILSSVRCTVQLLTDAWAERAVCPSIIIVVTVPRKGKNVNTLVWSAQVISRNSDRYGFPDILMDDDSSLGKISLGYGCVGIWVYPGSTVRAKWSGEIIPALDDRNHKYSLLCALQDWSGFFWVPSINNHRAEATSDWVSDSANLLKEMLRINPTFVISAKLIISNWGYSSLLLTEMDHILLSLGASSTVERSKPAWSNLNESEPII